MNLTIETLIEGRWHQAALLEFTEPDKGPAGACAFEYDFDYLREWIGKETPLAAVSLRLPVEFGPRMGRRWPSFLDDIRPLGSGRRWWLRRLNLRDETASEPQVLRHGTIAPIGNLRIQEAVPPKQGPAPRFARHAVILRQQEFLEYAAEVGAQVGGATGAGGDSPKLLLRQDDAQQVWIDAWQDEPANPDRYFLVKFARGNTERDRLILRSEYVYYRALHELGVDTIPVDGMSLEHGPNGPSLWLPRFDVSRRDGLEVRYGLESIYSLLESQPGASLTHQDVIAALQCFITTRDWREVLLEYLKRDLLNLVFGNSDNHGRNIALLKTTDAVRLAPVFDFAPMKMDPEGVTRTTRWREFEVGGTVDWPALLTSFGRDEAFLREGLRELALRLKDLPELLSTLGLPIETLTFEPLGLRDTEKKLRRWTLL
ncbi:MAG TPA: HipA domain-containing protein [Myxococcaceae bacterium]|nr:HipA domain-containing protein [Myxococcaceae bacterium]